MIAVLWLAMTLAVAPLQALAVQPATGDGDPCPMSAETAPDMHAAGHAAHHPVDQNAGCADCEHCETQSCGQEGCPGGSCTGVQLPPSALSALSVAKLEEPDLGVLLAVDGIVSRTDPPLLRPPV